MLLLAELTQYRTQTPFCLRQQGTCHFICVSFLRSQSAKTKHKTKIKHRSAEGWIADHISPAIVWRFSRGWAKTPHKE
jgi:hypothetical protein